jgi:hypothetical protein
MPLSKMRKKAALPTLNNVSATQEKFRDLISQVPIGKCIQLKITLPGVGYYFANDRKPENSQMYRLDFFKIDIADEKRKKSLGSYLVEGRVIGDWFGGKFRMEDEFLESLQNVDAHIFDSPKNEATLTSTNIRSSILPKTTSDSWWMIFEVFRDEDRQAAIRFVKDNSVVTRDISDTQCGRLLGR